MKKYIFLLIMIFSLSLNAAEEMDVNYSAAGSAIPSNIKSQHEWRDIISHSMYTGNLHNISLLLQSGVSTKNALQGLIYAVQFLMERIGNLPEPELTQLTRAQYILHSILQYKPNINESGDDGGYTPLSLASMFGVFPIAKTLISLGADVNLGSNEEGYPITNVQVDNHLGVLEKSFEIFKLLISVGVDINKQDDRGSLLLKTADKLTNNYQAEKQTIRKKIMYLLLLNGADLELGTRNMTFYNYLNVPNVKEVVDEFIKAILNANNFDQIKGAENALLIAAYSNNTDLVDQLLRKGVRFRSEKNEKYFNNLITGKPEMHEVVKQYKKDLSSAISEPTGFIPDLTNIVARY